VSYVDVWPFKAEFNLRQPHLHVVVLSSPAPVAVRIAVDTNKVCRLKVENAPDESVVGHFVFVLVDGDGQMPGLVKRTRVHYAVIFGQEINVMEDDAVEGEGDVLKVYLAGLEAHYLEEASVH